jgi:hypothetical protein
VYQLGEANTGTHFTSSRTADREASPDDTRGADWTLTELTAAEEDKNYIIDYRIYMTISNFN